MRWHVLRVVFGFGRDSDVGNGCFDMLLLSDVTGFVVVSDGDGDGTGDGVVRRLGMNVEGDGAMACRLAASTRRDEWMRGCIGWLAEQAIGWW